MQTQDATIYLTDQVKGHPNIKEVSREIMFSVYDFYRKPEKAGGFRKKMFTDYHRLAEDSAGFQIMMGKFASMEELFRDFSIPAKTIEIYKRIGITKNDLPIQLDIPPWYNLPKTETLAIVRRSAEFYHFMRTQIPEVIPVVHGWTLKQLQQSLEWIEDPDRLAAGTNIPMSVRTKNVMSAGSNKSASGGSQYILDHVTSNKSHVAVGANQQSGQFVCNGIANTPARMKQKAIGAGAMNLTPVVVDNVVSSHPRSKTVSVGANQQSGTYVLQHAGNRKKKAGIPKEYRAPQKVVLERLALVLNLLKDRELFILGGASSHFQHMIFMGGAKYTDTSSWRLKAYMASIYLPEVGARAIGYKETDPRIKKGEIPILRSCLNNPTHPLHGMSVDDFLELGKMNVKGFYETVKRKMWPCKPFDARALHNAWVLKHVEEEIANEYACDPEKYYKYLICKRFRGHRNLTKRCKKLWSMLKEPYVQSDLSVFLISKTK